MLAEFASLRTSRHPIAGILAHEATGFLVESARKAFGGIVLQRYTAMSVEAESSIRLYDSVNI